MRNWKNSRSPYSAQKDLQTQERLEILLLPGAARADAELE